MDTAISIFNIILGMLLTLTGFGIIHPFDKNKEKKIMEKFRIFFKIGGIAMFLWGIVGFIL
jgi:hypothetical protein